VITCSSAYITKRAVAVAASKTNARSARKIVRMFGTLVPQMSGGTGVEGGSQVIKANKKNVTGSKHLGSKQFEGMPCIVAQGKKNFAMPWNGK